MARFSRRRTRRRAAYRKKGRRTRRRTMRKRGRGIKGSLNVHRYVRAQEQTLYNAWNPLPPSGAIVQIDNNPIFELPQITNNGTSQPYANNVNLVSDMQFQISKTDGYTEFTSLYDQYRIEKVVIKMEYKGNAQGAGTASTSQTSLMPSVLYFNDYDDGTNTNFNEWKQRAATARKWNLSTPLVHTVRPTVLLAGLQEGTIGTYNVKRSPWIDLGYTTVNHYGFKFLIQDWPLWSGSNSEEDVVQACLRVTVKYYLTFRNVR